ncbi:OLC1v1011933C1 [Oldenlandia corymbosa var. corymbosa]|uniref:Probable magnesium transporter n=1 Tax=Oldenlandia corymbosa var. corymbosa TaxID=529605 RepID=A0AAV1DUT3_OLDCO|nr:OLC1v1011933C1 [Oldenlandia corymbosa var. corymbosa]
MGEWVIGAFINLFGSIAINFGTNLLKLGHDERGRQSVQGIGGTNGKPLIKPIISFHSWRVGILFFALGNCLNFISFGYAAQYYILACFLHCSRQSTNCHGFYCTWEYLLVAFGNHQSPVYTPEELVEKYSNIPFLLYCLILIIIVVVHHSLYRRGEFLLAVPSQDLKQYWQMLLPFSYAVVSGAVGSCSVLFAKSLSNLLRLSFSSGYQLHSWFMYSLVLLFLSTAGFWMARLNEGLSLFDAILIVPMFQIVWTFFSICTGFVYFQEYQVFDILRTTMFVLGVFSVFIGISLLAPDDSKGGETKDATLLVSATSSLSTDAERLATPPEDSQIKDASPFARTVKLKAANLIVKAKAACSITLGLGENSLHASSVLVMPMVSSKITGFRGSGFGRAKLFSPRGAGWSRLSVDEEEGGNLLELETTSMLPQSITAK